MTIQPQACSAEISPPAPHFLISPAARILRAPFPESVLDHCTVSLLPCLLVYFPIRCLPACLPTCACLQAYLYLQLVIKSLNCPYLPQLSAFGSFSCCLTLTCLTAASRILVQLVFLVITVKVSSVWSLHLQNSLSEGLKYTFLRVEKCFIHKEHFLNSMLFHFLYDI